MLSFVLFSVLWNLSSYYLIHNELSLDNKGIWLGWCTAFQIGDPLAKEVEEVRSSLISEGYMDSNAQISMRRERERVLRSQ